MNYESWKDALRGERLPLAAVHLEAFDRNVDKFASWVKPTGHKIRVASKSIRVPALIKRVLDYGDPYQGLMCYSAEEAYFLHSKGLNDFLVAYPTLQKSDLVHLRDIHESGGLVSMVVDSEEAIRRVAEFFKGTSRPFPLLLELDVTWSFFGIFFGQRRSPLRDAQSVLDLVRKMENYREVQFHGMMTYESIVAGMGVRNPFRSFIRNWAVGWVRSRSIQLARRRRKELADVFEKNGIKPTVFNGGGTGSVKTTVQEPWLTEVTVGSGFVCSHHFSYYPDLPLEPAAFFALQAVRSSDPGYVTLQGGGYVASADPGWERLPVPYLPEGSKLRVLEGVGEVSTPISLVEPGSVAIGDPVLFRHAKAGELAERFKEYLLVQDGKIQERVETYRGSGECFF